MTKVIAWLLVLGTVLGFAEKIFPGYPLQTWGMSVLYLAGTLTFYQLCILTVDILKQHRSGELDE